MTEVPKVTNFCGQKNFPVNGMSQGTCTEGNHLNIDHMVIKCKVLISMAARVFVVRGFQAGWCHGTWQLHVVSLHHHAWSRQPYMARHGIARSITLQATCFKFKAPIGFPMALAK